MDSWKALAPPEYPGPAFSFGEEHTPPLPPFRPIPMKRSRLQLELPISAVETNSLRASIFVEFAKQRAYGPDNLQERRPSATRIFQSVEHSESQSK